MDASSCEERFRDEPRRGTVVLVGIVEPVGVELDLAVVEVEVRRVLELAIGVRNHCPRSSMAPDLEVYFLIKDYVLLILNFIRWHPLTRNPH